MERLALPTLSMATGRGGRGEREGRGDGRSLYAESTVGVQWSVEVALSRASGRNVGKVFNPVVKLVLENQPFLALSTCKYGGDVAWQSLTVLFLPPLPLSSRTTLRM